MGPRQGALFYEFSIEDHVPPDHLLRSVDWFVDLGGMRRLLAPTQAKSIFASLSPRVSGPELSITFGSAFIAEKYGRSSGSQHLRIRRSVSITWSSLHHPGA